MQLPAAENLQLKSPAADLNAVLDVSNRGPSQMWLQKGMGQLSTKLECQPTIEGFMMSRCSYMCDPGCSCSILSAILK